MTTDHEVRKFHTLESAQPAPQEISTDSSKTESENLQRNEEENINSEEVEDNAVEAPEEDAAQMKDSLRHDSAEIKSDAAEQAKESDEKFEDQEDEYETNSEENSDIENSDPAIEGYLVQERSGNRPLILSISKRRDPFHIYRDFVDI